VHSFPLILVKTKTGFSENAVFIPKKYKKLYKMLDCKRF